ncbi:hypothetical protein BGX31_004187 [Mortierella sp. GBA43]|nr:hypothetical protein BGX31_004187 [Mortierella sp. GBA43]
MPTAAESLAQDLLLAMESHHLADISIIAFGQTFSLHRLVLLRSGYFRSLILGQGDWFEKSRQSITIPFDDPYVTLQAFQRTIHWLYGIDYHYTEDAAPSTFRPTIAPSGLSRATGLGIKGSGLRQPSTGSTMSDTVTYSERTDLVYQDNIMLDPSDKVDELLISMYSTASYLNITALTDKICSDIARRIRDNRGLIQYMEYAWKLDNGRAWDVILAHCFYQFFWHTYKSMTLQDMLVSPSMPTVGLVKVLMSESLWVPNEYERYQLVKGIMLRRLSLDTDKMMDWIYDYHEQDWFEVLKELDDDGSNSYELTPDAFMNNLQDWDATSTTEYEDAVGSDHEWAATEKELRRRSSQISIPKALTPLDEDRTATPTADTVLSQASRSRQADEHEDNDEEQLSTPTEKHTTAPQSPILGSPISSPALSALSITSDTLPRHQVRDLLIFMYLLHHSIHYTHMSFDQLHQILSEGLVLPARVKDAFWREHQLRRIVTSTSPTPASQNGHGRRRGPYPHRGRRGSTAPDMQPQTKSSRPPTQTSSTNSLGLLPVRFSTSLYISRRDLMSDRKHFTTSTFYGGSWWSVQVGYFLNATEEHQQQVGVYLNSSPVPRSTPNPNGRGSSRPSRSSTAGILAAFRGDQHHTAAAAGGTGPRRAGGTPSSSQQGAIESDGIHGDCSGVYNRQRELSYTYRIYMTTNVVEPQEFFEASVTGRLEEIRGKASNTTIHTNDLFRPRLRGEGAAAAIPPSTSETPEMSPPSTFARSSQSLAAKDEMAGEDPFMLNDAWGFRNWPYLTRVARQARDQPPRSSQGKTRMSSSSYDGVHDTQQQAPIQGVQRQQQQQMQQQNHGQQQHGPIANNQPGQAIQQAQQQNLMFPGHHHQQQQQQQAHGPQNNAQPAVNMNLNVAQGLGAQPPHLEAQPMLASSPPNSSYTSNSEETDDGLWIHFVVKVGWTDRKRPDEKAA